MKWRQPAEAEHVINVLGDAAPAKVDQLVDGIAQIRREHGDEAGETDQPGAPDPRRSRANPPSPRPAALRRVARGFSRGVCDLE